MPNLLVRKRNGKWEYRFECAKVKNKRQWISKSGFKTKKEAEIEGNKSLNQYNNTGLNFTPSEISFSDYLDFWINEYCMVNLKPATVTNYTKKIRLHIKPVLGSYALKSISTAALQKLINDMFNNGYSRNTLLSVKGLLNSCFRYAVKPLGFISNNPAVMLKLPLKNAEPDVPTRKEERYVISAEDMNTILKRFPEGTTAHIPLILGYRCGLRLGEAFAVTWDCIDFENKTLTINKQLQWKEKDKSNPQSESYWFFTNPKYNSIRTIDIDDDTLNLLMREKERQNRAKVYYGNSYKYNVVSRNSIRRLSVNGEGDFIDLVLIRENGEFIQPRIMQHTSYIIHNQLGINFNFHSLRHTHCSMLAEQNTPVKYIQSRLGHKNVSVTLQIYEHVTERISNEGRNILNTIYKNH